MAVIVKYIVERDGVEKMTFTDKKDADQYDKMLDIADNLFEFIGHSELPIEEDIQENLALYLAQNAGEVTNLLKGTKPKASKAPKAKPKNDSDTQSGNEDMQPAPAEMTQAEPSDEEHAQPELDEPVSA